jgi:hypothetical protein
VHVMIDDVSRELDLVVAREPGWDESVVGCWGVGEGV